MNTIASRIRKILLCLASTYCAFSMYLSHSESAVALNVFKDWYQNSNNVKIAIAIDTSTKDNTTSINNNNVPEKKQDEAKVMFANFNFSGGEDQATAIIVATRNANPKAEKDEAERQRIAAAAASQMIGDFDFSQPGIPCGSKKCFIPSKTLKEVGYLIGGKLQSKLQIGYEFGRHLQERFGIPNILLGPPQSISSDSNVTELINQKTYKLANGNYKKEFKSKTLTIQKARTVPFDDNNNTFFVKCNGSRLNRTRFMWKDFQQSLSDIAASGGGGGKGKGGGWLSLRRTGSRDNKDLFLRQFQESVDQLSLVIKNEPLFVYDLQFLVTAEGQMHHVDYDRIEEGWRYREGTTQRHFDKRMTKYWEECLDFLHEMKHDAVIDITTTTDR